MKDKELLNRLRDQERLPQSWNPLESDTYAAGLVEKYEINVTWDSTHTGKVWRAWRFDKSAVDPDRRRAICRVALNGN